MRKFLKITAGLIVAILLFQHCQKSDFIVITGVVRDANTKMPIEGAYVVWQNSEYTRTASNGTFSINGVRSGKVDFYVVNFNGYYSKSTSANISEGRVNKVDFELSPIEKPEIETGVVSSITLHSASLTGSIHWKNTNWAQYGFCWSTTNTAPSLSDTYVMVGSSSSDVTFSYNLTNLLSDQIYYVRAFANTNSGTLYGNSVVFRTTELPISNGLLAFYPFTGNFEDQSGNGINLYHYAVSSVTSPSFANDRFGLSNNAFSSSDYYFTYSSSSQFVTFNQFSISFWFKKSSWAGSDKSMINTGYYYYNNEIRIDEDASPNKLYFLIKTGVGTTYKVSAASAPSLNTWHHVVAQRTSTAIELYIDGILQGFTNCDTQPIVNDPYGWGYLFVGFDLKSSWTYFNGSLDDIRIYNRPLISSEIQYLKTH